MENIVNEILNSANMRECTNKFVDTHQHDEVVDLFQALTYAFFELEDADPREEELNELLDAMSGHSSVENRIGTGNYAW